MSFSINVSKALFTSAPCEILRSDVWSVVTKKYPSGIESLTIHNARGYVEVLPFMGQIIWDACFDGTSLRMTNMFPEPKPATLIEDTYGCFAFHSGLLAAGCPGPEDDHPLHGEFACAPMDSARLIVADDSISVESRREYVKGFGHHYLAEPSVTLRSDSTMFDIGLRLTNLSAHAPMPLQYMCHMNYAFVAGAIMSQNLPQGPSACVRRSPITSHRLLAGSNSMTTFAPGSAIPTPWRVPRSSIPRSSTLPTTSTSRLTMRCSVWSVPTGRRCEPSSTPSTFRSSPDGSCTIPIRRWRRSPCPVLRDQRDVRLHARRELSSSLQRVRRENSPCTPEWRRPAPPGPI